MTGRTESGRFAKGNPGGPGRPRRQVEVDYLRTLAKACGPDEWREVCEKAVELARAGDAPARAWLAKYLCGDTTLQASLDSGERMAMLLDDLC